MDRRGSYRKLAAGLVVVGTLGAYGVPAMAATSSTGSAVITYSTTSGCSTCRTLVLLEADGKTPLTGLNLSPGTNSFIANVVDQGVDPAALGNFSVGATMSNLYEYDQSTGTYTCTVSIPSSDVTLNSAPALLNASALSSAVQPVFSITGNLSSILTTSLTSLLGTTTVNTNPTISNVQAETDAALTQAAEAGNTAPAILSGTFLNNLPMTLSSGTGGAFATAAAPPAGSNCSGSGTGATSLPVLNGALNGVLAGGTPLLSDTSSFVQQQTSATTPANPTVTQMISEGYLDAATAESLISQATGVPESDLNQTTGPWAGILTDIENTLTGAVTGLVSSATTLSGTYGAEPVMAVSAPSATPANYQGVLTVTLTSQ